MRKSIQMEAIRKLSTSSVHSARAKAKWIQELYKKSNCDRAVEHFDDFYGSVYGKKKWPSLRLALLSPAKYMAVPNPYTGSVEEISSKLDKMGAHSVHDLWEVGRKELFKSQKDIDMKKDLGRIHEMERALESIAMTKQAEEVELMYQNDPSKGRGVSGHQFPAERQREGYDLRGMREEDSQRRVLLHDPSEAAFVPTTKLKGIDDFAFDSEYYSSFLPSSVREIYDDKSSPFIYTKPGRHKKLEFPQLLRPYTFVPGSAQQFPGAGKDSTTGLREYICVNGGSIAPILALDLHPDVRFLDLCSGPGTKSLMALFTMRLNSMVCNDIDHSRLWRVKRIFKEFLGTDSPDSVAFTKFNGKDYPASGEFTRVLADVPCLSDRTSCNESDNNIFKTTRTKERLGLVAVQKAILISAFKSMSTDDKSATVYSTCTLSPIENDGVVMQALKETEVSNLAIDLQGLLEILKPFEHYQLFKLSRTRFGVVIEPNIISNFGPMYICRVVVQKQVSEPEPTPANEES